MSKVKSLGGRLWFQQTPLLDGERVILEDNADYSLVGWIRAPGKLFLTNRRLVFCPWRMPLPWRMASLFLLSSSPKASSLNIALSDITDVRPGRGIAAFLDWARLEVRTARDVHKFSFGFYGGGKPRRWIDALENQLRSSALQEGS